MGVARAVLAEGRFDEAVVLFRRLAEEHPDSSSVALWRGHALRLSGNAPGAATEYTRALDLNPENSGALLALGNLEWDAGNLRDAGEYYERAIAATPAFPLPHRKAAAVEVERERHGAAIAHLQAYLELRPDDVEAMKVLGFEQYLNEDLDGSAETLERVLESAPEDADAHFGLGTALADRPEHYERALEHLRYAAERDPDNPTTFYFIGRIHQARAEFEEARASFERALRLSPNLSDVHYRMAIVLSRLGESEAAREHQLLFRELSQAEKDQEAHERRVNLLQDSMTIAIAAENFAGVRSSAADLIDAVPDDPDVLSVVARMSLVQNELDSAFAATSQAIEADPEHWEALYLHGMVLNRRGDPEEARGYFERSLAINPLYAATQNALGNVLLALDDVDTALTAYRAAIALDGEEASYYLNLAVVYARLGLTDLEAEARESFRRLQAEEEPSR